MSVGPAVRCGRLAVLEVPGARDGGRGAAAKVSAESGEERPEEAESHAELAPSAAGRPPRLWADGGFQFIYPRKGRGRGEGESRCCPERGGQRRLLQSFR